MKYLQALLTGILVTFLPPAHAEGELKPVWKLIQDYPSAVLYDTQQNRLLVANVQEQLPKKGYISLVSVEDGQILEKEWLSGLSTPGGMGRWENTLYVADWNTLYAVDFSSKEKTSYQVPQKYLTPRTVLSDVAVDTQGNVYVSETLGNKIYCLCEGQFDKWLDIESPGGLLAEKERLLVVNSKTATISAVSLPGKTISSVSTLEPAEGTLLGGIAADGEGGYYVSEIMLGKLFHLSAEGEMTVVGQLKPNLGDFIYLPTENLLVVPMPVENILQALNISPTSALSSSTTPSISTTPPSTSLLSVQTVGNGTVLSEPKGIDCGSTCTAAYPRDVIVTLSAKADSGFQFHNWAGDCTGIPFFTSVAIGETPKTCIAVFVTSPHPSSSAGPYNPSVAVNTWGTSVAGEMTVAANEKISHAVFLGQVINQGWVSNSTIAEKARLEGGVLTGYIKNEGTLANFTFVGAALEGGKLEGEIMNESKVGGTIANIALAPNAHLSGGRLAGVIEGDPEAPAVLENVRVMAGSYLSGVKLGDHVILEADVKIEEATVQTTPLPPSEPKAIAVAASGETVATATQFEGRVLVNGHPVSSVQPLMDAVAISGTIVVDPAHIGQVADLFVYLVYQSTADAKPINLMIDSQGGLFLWNGKLADLVAFQKEITLSSPLVVKIYDGVLFAAGLFKVTFGYRLKDGTVVYSAQSIDFTSGI